MSERCISCQGQLHELYVFIIYISVQRGKGHSQMDVVKESVIAMATKDIYDDNHTSQLTHSSSGNMDSASLEIWYPNLV